MPRPKVSTSNTITYTWGTHSDAMDAAIDIASHVAFRPFVVPVNYDNVPDSPVRGQVYFIINPSQEG